MLQRIQTVYLFLVVVLMALTMILPVAEYFDAVKNVAFQLDYRGIVQTQPTDAGSPVLSANPLTFLFGMVLVATLAALFKYKNRRQQFRLCTVNMFLILIYMIVLGVYIYLGRRALDGTELSLKLPVIFPVIALILNFLAMRGIMKDENLIKSINRLR